MATTDLDYAKVTGRFAITVGDTADAGDEPDIIWCTEGSVSIEPLQTYTKVSGAAGGPFSAGHSVITASIGADGHLTYLGKQYVLVVDLTSDKVNPQIGPNKATHQIRFNGVKADGTAVNFPTVPVRLTKDGPDGDGVNDLTDLIPLVPGVSQPIYRGEKGVGILGVAIVDGDQLQVELTDGTTLEAGQLPAGPGGSDPGVAGYLADENSESRAALDQANADLLDDPASAFRAGVTASIDARVPVASTTAQGKVELATVAEAQAGTDTIRALTPAAAAAAFATARTALAASPVRKPRPTDYMVERFATGHGWSIGGGWATSNLNDASAAVWGSQGLSGTTTGQGAANPATFGKAASTNWATFDPTTNILEFALTLDNPARLDTMLVYVSSSGSLGTNNKAVQVLGPGEAALVMGANETTIISVNLNETGTITGTGAGSAVDSIRLWFKDTGAALGVKVGGIRRHARVQASLPNGAVCFTFDDCYGSQLDAARYLNYRGGKGTFFVGRDVLGTAGKLTLANLHDFQDFMGHEIAAHVGTGISSLGIPSGHVDLTTLSADQLEAYLQAEKYWLTANSFRSESFATPFGASNAAVRRAIAQYFRQAAIVGGPPETLPPADPYRIRRVSLESTVTLASAKARLDSAAAQGRLVTFLIHDLVTSGATGTQWLKADFEALVDYSVTTYASTPLASLGDVMQLVA